MNYIVCLEQLEYELFREPSSPGLKSYNIGPQVDNPSSENSENFVVEPILSGEVDENDIKVLKYLHSNSTSQNLEVSQEASEYLSLEEDYKSVPYEILPLELTYWTPTTNVEAQLFEDSLSSTSGCSSNSEDLKNSSQRVRSQNQLKNKRVGKVSKNLDRRDFK